ncbi:hypothetical protein PTSG_07350 [Salpingoeca rosetta]|uniref:Uncharacterized protein n=1 Tax=Salpingoeca rosetta (strain ATCC 50818 / BSB-021) TaxID=946362 RepID=F2UJ59_SALR5|nr:uncharacterized protein PTSG_07350 [Salpingoeca rosetta]EGD77007.1 hypothetical protein PTSG_07350 [Salpingoeca rosetta]|eukprot:XP_004990847.1 hypothetical protein PTSG_07350 [Salpingoeca rosetta]
MERLQACRQDLVLLEGQIAPRDGVPTFEQFSVAWRQLSFSAVHLAANDQMERQLVLDTMCHAATDMLDATLEQRIQVCGVFVLYSLWKTALKGQQFKIPADPSSWPNIINLYNTWEASTTTQASTTSTSSSSVRRRMT